MDKAKRRADEEKRRLNAEIKSVAHSLSQSIHLSVSRSSVVGVNVLQMLVEPGEHLDFTFLQKGNNSKKLFYQYFS